MIIGIDGSRAFINEKTGTENYSYQLLKAIAKFDTENIYLVYLRPGQNPGNEWPKNYKFKIINYKFLWTQIGLAVRTFIDPIDVLFVPSHTLPLIRKPGLKTVITVHDLGAEYLPGSHQLKQLLYLNLMTHYQLKTATGIIAVSEATKKDLVKKAGVGSEKIKVIYEGVDKEVFSHQPSAISKTKNDIQNDIVKKYDLERGKYFLFVGTIQPRKNLERLIRAFGDFLTMEDRRLGMVVENGRSKIDKAKNPPSTFYPQKTILHLPSSTVKLVLVGQKGWKSDPIYKLPKELGIEEDVRFLGRVSDAELAGLYNGALALAYPSLFEGFGLPILEAFSCGCPVITSNISSMPEVAGNAAILVDPLNIKEISNAMGRLITDDSLRSTLIKKGTIRLKKFDWKKTAEETIEIIERTVKAFDNR